MDQFWKGGDRLERFRRWILWVFVFGLVGTIIELLLLQHFKDPWQFVPLVLIVSALVTVVWHTKRRNPSSLRALRIIMILFLISGFAGVGLHLRGAVEFQLETDPTMNKWELAKKVMVVTAPPLLAPGVMLQLGLIGLAYTLSDSEGKRSEMP